MSGWTIKGEYVTVEEDNLNRVYSQIYVRGINQVPIVLLGDTQEYGEIVNDYTLKIQKDRYFAVHGGLRQKIIEDFAYKIRLRTVTTDVLQAFAQMVATLEGDVTQHTLTADQLDGAIQACIRAVSLVEYNGMLPLNWYQERLATILMDDDRLKWEDFAYCEVMPHRLLLRCGKLRLLMTYFDKGGALSDDDVARFIWKFGLYDPTMTDPLELRPLETDAFVRQEIESMATITTREEAQRELQHLIQNRREGRKRYHHHLAVVAERFKQQGASVQEIRDFVSALSILSLAATEEEYRHIWMDRFWRSLGIIVRTLELPVATTSIEEVSASFRQRSAEWVPN